jgi:glucose-1-phosphate thymidylyltransferase
VIAVVLAAGYATRLQPLSETIPKPLLPIAGRPMLDHIAGAIERVEEVQAIHVVTNHRFHPMFRDWARRRRGDKPVIVWDDGTTSNETRRGALADLQLVLERAGAAENDVLVVAGDNLFDLDLRAFVDFWRLRASSSAIALYHCPELELVRRYSAVELDADGRVVAFSEKPAEPTTHWVGVAIYLYCAAHARRLGEYLAGGGSADAPGNFVAWLHERAPVYGFALGGEWLDIGDHEQLLHADNTWRVKRGLPVRMRYSPV